MNLRYYLRGLGIGITVTALILGIAMGNGKETLTNDEIREKARALGMVEGSVTVAEAAAQKEDALDADQEADDKGQEASIADESEASDEDPEKPAEEGSGKKADEADDGTTAAGEEQSDGQEASIADESEASDADPEKPSQEAVSGKTAQDEAEVTQPAEEMITITVNRGEGSYTICEKLAQAGLVEDAAEFDAYLCQNGYHTRIRAGEHSIPVNAKSEEIAALLCK